MADDEPNEVVHEPDEVCQRSASSLIFQGMASTGQLAAGLGGLGVGVAAVKGKIGGGAKEQNQQDEKHDESGE